MLAANGPVRIEEAILVFRDSASTLPSLELRAAGELFGAGFTADLFGTFAHTIREFRAIPPLTDALVRTNLTEVMSGSSPVSGESAQLSLSAPSALTGDAPVYVWAPIIIIGAAPVEEVVQEAADPAPSLPIESATPAAGTNL